MVQAYAALKSKGRLKRITYDLGEIQPDQIEVDVLYCGLCHSDLSMINNEWGDSVYPLVPGHEIVGRVAQLGAAVTQHKIGDIVGVGWFSASCLNCHQCLSGNHNLCDHAEQIIVGRHGGFAEKLRCQAQWAIPLPAALDIQKAAPLFCAGITVFNALVQFDVKPTQRVGVIGIGGLGHLALQFANKWGCEVTAFTSTNSKRKQSIQMGAHHAINSRDASRLKKIAGSLDFILATAAADLDWEAYLQVLAPKGRLDIVGIIPSPIPLPAFSLIGRQRSVSGSLTGSPAALHLMLGFCARHGIEPVVEKFPMSRVNDALDRMAAGKARYRIVLENDF